MPLHVDRHDRVALLTLDEPERRNALTAPLVAEIVAAMDELDADPAVGAIVVTGAPPAFCSGADVQALAAMASGDRGARRRPGHLRRVPPHPGLAAAHRRRGQRRRGRRRLQPGAGLRRAHRRDERACSTHGSSASGSIPAAGTPGCSTAPPGRRPPRRWTSSASASTAPGPRPWGWPGSASPTTRCSSGRWRSRRGPPRSRGSWRSGRKPRFVTPPALDAHDAAMRFELVHQVWSLRENFGPAGDADRR